MATHKHTHTYIHTHTHTHTHTMVNKIKTLIVNDSQIKA